MIAAGDDEPCIRQSFGNDVEGLDHEFQPLVGSPFAERQDAMLRIAAAGKIRILRSACQNTVGSHVNILAAVFFVKDFAIARHQHRNRIRQQQQPRRKRSGKPVGARMPHSCILQVDGIHQVMQSDVRIAAA
jgi:hypothetical protein